MENTKKKTVTLGATALERAKEFNLPIEGWVKMSDFWKEVDKRRNALLLTRVNDIKTEDEKAAYAEQLKSAKLCTVEVIAGGKADKELLAIAKAEKNAEVADIAAQQKKLALRKKVLKGEIKDNNDKTREINQVIKDATITQKNLNKALKALYA